MALVTLFIATRTPIFAIGIVGVLAVPALAIWAGVAAASMIDSRTRLNAALVVASTLLVLALYMKALASLPPPPGAAYGAASVPAPADMSKGAASVPPPTSP